MGDEFVGEVARDDEGKEAEDRASEPMIFDHS